MANRVVTKAELDAPFSEFQERQGKFALVTEPTKSELRRNIPSTLNPDSVNNMGREVVDLMPDGPGLIGFDTCRRGLKELYEALHQIDEAHTKLLQPVQVGTENSTGKPIMQLKIPTEQARDYENAVSNKNARMTHIIKRTADVMDQSIADLDRRVALAVRHPRADTAPVLQEAAEIRSYIKNLPQNERANFVNVACDKKDLDVVNAVLSVSAYASGITPEQKEMLRTQAQLAFAPREHRHAENLRKMKSHFIEAIDVYSKEVAKRRPVLPPGANAGQDALAKLREVKPGSVTYV